MKTQHTPGPWTVAPAKGTLCAWRIETSTRPCVAFVTQTIGNTQEENANAALIAAAPELLEALKALSQKISERPGEARWSDEMKQAVVVIAKAEGRTE